MEHAGRPGSHRGFRANGFHQRKLSAGTGAQAADRDDEQRGQSWKRRSKARRAAHGIDRRTASLADEFG